MLIVYLGYAISGGVIIKKVEWIGILMNAEGKNASDAEKEIIKATQ